MATSVKHVQTLVDHRQDNKEDYWQTMAMGDPSLIYVIRDYPNPLTDNEKFLASKYLFWNSAFDTFKVTAGGVTWVETTDMAEAVRVFNETMEMK